MKKIKLILLSKLIVMVGIVWGQSPCALPTIVTDPTLVNPTATDKVSKAINTERPDMVNSGVNQLFDWRDQSFNYYNQYSEDPTARITSIFYLGGGSTTKPPLAIPAQKDYEWMDGWELIKRDFGFLNNGSINPVGNLSPYYILYNRYSGTFRVIASFNHLDPIQIQSIKVTLKFVDPNPDLDNYANLGTSGLLNMAAAPAYPLDQQTLITEVSAYAQYITDGDFFYADFQLGYDPCTCLFESGLLVEFETYTTAGISLYGNLLATSNPINENTSLDQLAGSGYLTNIYTMDPGTALSQVGILTYNNLTNLSSDFNQEATKIADQKQNAKVLKTVATVAQVGAVVATEIPPLALALEGIAVVSDFFAGKMDKPYPTPPSTIHGEMTLTGTVTSTRSIPGADISMVNPGSKNSKYKPAVDDNLDPNSSTLDNLTYPVYNLPLGVFGLMNTPQVDFYRVTMGNAHSNSGNDWREIVRYEYRLSSDVQYTFNPSLDIDFELTTVKGALVIETYPDYHNGQDQVGAYHNVNRNYQLFHPEIYKEVFMTDLVPLKDLSTIVPTLEWWRYGSLDPDDQPTNVFLKLFINVVYKSTNSAGGRNMSTYVVKYKPNINWKSNGLSGIPFDQHYDGGPYGSESHLIGEIPVTVNGGYFVPNSTISFAYDPAHYYSPTYNVNSSTPNFFSWENITILGSDYQFGPGMQTITFTSAKDIIQDCESVIGVEMIMQNSNTYIQPISSPAITNSSYVYNYCMGLNSTGVNYQANTSQKSSSVVLRKAVDKNLNNGKLQMQVYPNPINENGRINYSIPSSDNVTISVSDILGHKVLDVQNSFQNQGNYQLELPVEKLNEGIYFCTLESGGKVVTSKIIVSR